MDKSIAIQAKNISKTFTIQEDSHNTVKHRLFNIFNPPRTKKVEALKMMSFEIKKGECVGLIGRNGCGKSTLTRLLAGVYPTDSGYIEINGSTLLLNLGVGMSHELTARENVYVSASVLGMKIKDIDLIFDKIISFAELEEFVDTKIKFFSSGMVARLGFSIAVNAGADIMFLDEIFAVGDMIFQEKAVKVFESSWIEGKTVIMVSHTMDVISKYCQRSAYMKNGRLEFFGDTQKAIEMYMIDNHMEVPAPPAPVVEPEVDAAAGSGAAAADADAAAAEPEV
ncbi:MAG: ABC transporter ATP-binding protein [Bacteroidetes bacterium]|nr:ABC transporter ATP-binding protein [Bacteroidota bacterium]